MRTSRMKMIVLSRINIQLNHKHFKNIIFSVTFETFKVKTYLYIRGLMLALPMSKFGQNELDS